jgi:hypothetical protein
MAEGDPKLNDLLKHKDTPDLQYLDDVNPDTLFSIDMNSISFCYSRNFGPQHLIFKKWPETHIKLLRDKDWLDIKSRYEALARGIILGRIGTFNSQKMVAFWNNEPREYADVKESLKTLMKIRLIRGPEMVIAPSYGEPMPVLEFLGGKQKKETGFKWQPELLAKLHTMPSPEKSAMLKAMGAKNEPKHTNSLPGVKWWAPTSESKLSFRDFLNLT